VNAEGREGALGDKVNAEGREGALGDKVNAEGREGALGDKVNAEGREGALGDKVNALGHNARSLGSFISNMIKNISHYYFINLLACFEFFMGR